MHRVHKPARKWRHLRDVLYNYLRRQWRPLLDNLYNYLGRQWRPLLDNLYNYWGNSGALYWTSSMYSYWGRDRLPLSGNPYNYWGRLRLHLMEKHLCILGKNGGSLYLEMSTTTIRVEEKTESLYCKMTTAIEVIAGDEGHRAILARKFAK